MVGIIGAQPSRKSITLRKGTEEDPAFPFTVAVEHEGAEPSTNWLQQFLRYGNEMSINAMMMFLAVETWRALQERDAEIDALKERVSELERGVIG